MSESLRQAAVRLIFENLGEVTAKTYEHYYADKSDEMVLVSIKELLTEMLGPKKCEEKIATLPGTQG